MTTNLRLGVRLLIKGRNSLYSSELQDDGGGGGCVAARYAKHQICTNDEQSVAR